MAGGVALNCVANGKILEAKMFEDIWIQPAAGDAGGAIGAAYAVWHIHHGGMRTGSRAGCADAMSGSYLGPEFSLKQIEHCIERHGARARHYEGFAALAADVASRLAAGEVGGWFQGRMEFGPRALGNRSIIGDPRNPEMQKRLNLTIKFREGFRPFAPSVLEEDAAQYFELDRPSPYMLLVTPVRKDRQQPLPPDYSERSMYDRLYTVRSDLPAITHVDYSARIQTVNRATNPRFWTLIDAFKRLTGCSVLINTSFNVRGEPIVCTPDEAYRCFMRTSMDFLAIGDFVFDKKEQPTFADDGWRASAD
jgi:carbamoyltransferase